MRVIGGPNLRKFTFHERDDSGYGEVRWDTAATYQDSEIVARRVSLTTVATGTLGCRSSLQASRMR